MSKYQVRECGTQRLIKVFANYDKAISFIVECYGAGVSAYLHTVK
jgi:hypothetical protein